VEVATFGKWERHENHHSREYASKEAAADSPLESKGRAMASDKIRAPRLILFPRERRGWSYNDIEAARIAGNHTQPKKKVKGPGLSEVDRQGKKGRGIRCFKNGTQVLVKKKAWNRKRKISSPPADNPKKGGGAHGEFRKERFWERKRGNRLPGLRHIVRRESETYLRESRPALREGLSPIPTTRKESPVLVIRRLARHRGNL